MARNSKPTRNGSGNSEEPTGRIVEPESEPSGAEESTTIESPTITGDATGDDPKPSAGNDGNGSRQFTEPESGEPASGAGTGTGRRGPGRPRGSRNSTGTGAVKLLRKTSNTAEDLGTTLKGIHFLLAKSLSIPELQLDAEESKELASASLRVAELYELPLPSDKIMAWVGLATCMSKVYGPRIGAYTIRKSRKPPTPIRIVPESPEKSATMNAVPQSPHPPAPSVQMNPSIFEPA